VGDLSDPFSFSIEGPGDDYFDGIALFITTNQNNWSMANRLDAVGSNFVNAINRLPLFVEGTGIQYYGDYFTNAQYSWVRRLESGTPQDTNNNVNDFVLVSPNGSLTAGSRTINTILGAPGPENSNSPTQSNATVKASLIDPQQPSTASPNRERDTTPVSNGALGTLTIRRKFTNKTGQTVTRLRFRIVDITTLNSPGGPQADLRALDSVNVSVPVTGGGTISVKGTTIEQPPAQTSGGGLNSTMVVALPAPLGANANVTVQFVLGVQQGGNFRFLVNVEAITAPPPGAQKLGGQRPGKRID